MSDDLLEQYVSRANITHELKCDWMKMRATRFSTLYIRCEGTVVAYGAYDYVPSICPHCKLNINFIN